MFFTIGLTLPLAEILAAGSLAVSGALNSAPELLAPY
jgi:predicted Kef-type K+ transport protein